MNVYCGIKETRYPGEVQVYKNGKAFSPARSLKLRSHSADGFQWGYGGSGPAQLALALLLDVLGKKAAEYWYQDFKARVVSQFRHQWAITSDAIRLWYETAKKEVGTDENGTEAVPSAWAKPG